MKKKNLSVLLASVLLVTSPIHSVSAQKVEKKQAPKSAATSYSWHPWRGKKVAYFGDSITDPNTIPGTSLYWNFLQQWLDITPWVYGVSGREWNDIPRQTDMLQQEHGDAVDAILIFCGTNDFNNSIPIGEWYNVTEDIVEAAVGKPKETVLRRHRQFSMNPNTFRGRINIAMDKLKRTYPTKQIVLLTPIHRAYFYYSDSNVQPDEMYPNGAGLYIDDYVASVKEASNVWSVPVIDLNGLSGLFPLEDAGAQLFNKKDTDRLHPNQAGHARMAKTLLYQLSALPCSF